VIFDFSGVGRAAARQKLEELLAHFPRPAIVIAAGFCGALRGEHSAGDVVVPVTVADENGIAWACHSLPEMMQRGRLLTAARIIGEPKEKAEFGQRFDADFVDMESAGVAEVCAARGLPFAAARAVSDNPKTALSPHLVGLLSRGSVSPLKAGWAILRRPSLLGEFRRLSRDTKLAARNLAEALVKIIKGLPA
jgi:nucleoside phosphorylase